MKPFDIIVALDQENGIGRDGALPWALSPDLQYFKKITTTTEDPSKINAVIMGRKTWESIPEKFRPLSNRLNVVLTRNREFVLPKEVMLAGSLEFAFQELSKLDFQDRIEKIFVVGGASIYAQALEKETCRTIYMTRIFSDFSCDTFFPSIDDKFKEIESSEIQECDDLTYCFSTFQNKTLG
ncbi:MAG: dihydrofolate reductase [Candidatus Omnitrophica bacterium]|nr:dihydrofolate reductase [Candidatus Omnitrophota bacterium]